MGDLAYWMDENFLYTLFVPTGALQTVKIIRNKASNASEGYGFVEFSTHAAAEDVLQTLNGTPIPNTDQIFRLNRAAFGVGKQTPEGSGNSESTLQSPSLQSPLHLYVILTGMILIVLLLPCSAC